jgi:small GTP-binding protein
MEKELISGLLYTKFDDVLGPMPVSWIPPHISEEIRMKVCIKTLTMLAGEENAIPESLVIIPFPSINFKGIIKYFKWDDKTKRGGEAYAGVILLFKEVDDLIFYKYLKNLEGKFEEITQKIMDLERINESIDKIQLEIFNFQETVSNTLEDLRISELAVPKTEAFPEFDEKVSEAIDYVFKIIVCGDPEVGKTSIVLRFTDNAFKRTYLYTVGVNITRKEVTFENRVNVQFVVWDIAGQSKYEMIRGHFYEGADGFFLVFDLSLLDSFKSISKWYQDIKKSLERIPKPIGFLIGNKKDLVDERKVVVDEALKLAQELNLEYIETSALTGESVGDAFSKIAKALITQKD